MKNKYGLVVGLLVSFCLSSAVLGGDPEPLPGADVCRDSNPVCTPVWATLTSMSCYETLPYGCCQVKNYAYECPGGGLYDIKHQYYHPFSPGCSGLTCP